MSYGACLVEKTFFDSTDDKIWPNFLFWQPFPPVDKVIENDFARDLEGIIQRYMGYRLGDDGSRRYGIAYDAMDTRWLLWYTAGTQHPCIH